MKLQKRTILFDYSRVYSHVTQASYIFGFPISSFKRLNNSQVTSDTPSQFHLKGELQCIASLVFNHENLIIQISQSTEALWLVTMCVHQIVSCLSPDPDLIHL